MATCCYDNPSVSAVLWILLGKNGEFAVDTDLEASITLRSGSLSTVKATTDRDGRFEFEGIVVGETYTLKLVAKKDAFGKPRSWSNIREFTADSAEPLEMGKVRINK